MQTVGRLGWHGVNWLPFLPAFVAPWLLFAPLWLTGKVLFWGTPALQFIPWWEYASATLRQGHLPLWNPLVGMGAPLLANYQSALLYPPNWVTLLAGTVGGVAGVARSATWIAMLHLSWAGMGMAALSRRLGLNPLAQAVSGLVFGLSGYLVARAGFLSITAAVAWIPWILLLVIPETGSSGLTRWKVVGSPARFLALIACLTMLLLAGHAQTAWYSLLLAGMWAIFWGWNAAPGSLRLRLRRMWQPALRLGVATVLAATLAAAQLLPTAEYLLQSQRSSAVDYDLAMTYSTWPWRFLSLLAPDLFGNPREGDYWGYGNYWEDAMYLGLLPLLLATGAVAGIFLRRRKPSALPEGASGDEVWSYHAGRLPGFLLVITLLAVVLALGKNTPVFPWLYRHIPTFALFQAPARYLVWTAFSMALLAGIGAQSWRRPTGRCLYWTRLGAMAAFAIIAGAGIAWLLFAGRDPTALPAGMHASLFRAAALAGVWGMLSALLSLKAPEKMEGFADGLLRTRWSWFVVTLVAADLLIAGWGLNPGIDVSFYQPEGIATSLPADTGGLRAFVPEETEQILKFQRYLRFDTFDPEGGWEGFPAAALPNLPMLRRTPSANNFDPLLPARYAQWMAAFSTATDATQERMLGLMDVGWLEELDASQPGGARFVRTGYRAGEAAVAPERIRWLPCARVAGSERKALGDVLNPAIDLSATVILESGSAELEPCATGGEVNIQVTAETASQLVIHSQTVQDGWLLLADAWYPGWAALIDGKPATLLHGDYLFRAVRLPAGEHVVEFAYRPAAFYAGAAISALALALFVAAVWVVARTRAYSPRSFQDQG